MFDGITKSLTGALSFFQRGKLTENNMAEGLEAVRQALLEADVNYDVAVEFTNRVAEQAAGTQLLKSLNPEQQIVGIVHDQLVQLMGPVDHALNIMPGELTVIMLCGLQGSGKTTTCGKLSKLILSKGLRPLLVAADLQRPAAIEQLKIIGEQVGVPVYTEQQPTNAVKVCQNGVAQARKLGNVNVVILDTAGRLHIDEDLMKELAEIDRRIEPQQIYFVCDSMTGQDAVNSAKAFNSALELDGVILTKLDGDTRGGAALSVKQVTGVPIKFIGVGEQLDKLEEFHPDRMAGRILGMGDIVGLYEKAQREFDQEEAAEQARKMQAGKFSLIDFKNMMGQIRKLGPMRDIMKMIPGMGGLSDMLGGDVDMDHEFSRVEGIINSMTLQERLHPDIIDISRRRRIAAGCGMQPADINKLLKEFTTMSGVMQQMSGLNKLQQFKAMKQMTDMGMFNPNAPDMQLKKERSARGPLDKRADQEKKKQKRKEAKQQRKKNRR